jgi:hypothetical protein
MAIGVQVTFDAADPRALGAFWCQALGYVEQPPPEGFADWDAALESWGMPPEDRDRAYAIVDPDGEGPRLFFQKVPEPKTAKNRVHLDVNAGGRGEGSRDRVRAHVGALEAVGATQVDVFGGDEPSGEFWIVMRDPEGNEFCVQ